MDPLARIFSSFVRLRLLRLFLFNDDQSFSLTDIVTRTKAAKDVVRKELGVLASADLIRKRSTKVGVRYSVHKRFPHYEALQAFIRNTTSVDDINMLTTLKKAGGIRLVVLSGLFTGALETKADLLIVGDKLEDKLLDSAVRSLEAELGRELRFASFSTEDFKYRKGVYDRLLRDIFDFPHRILLDRIGV